MGGCPDGGVGWVLDPRSQGPGFESRLATLSGSDTRSRCQRFGFPRRFGLSGGISGPRFRLVAASWPGGLEITTSSGCSGSSPRSALIKICANKKKGEDALEDALEDAEIPAAHL